MALYQDYETKILTENGIDIRDGETKRDIELYDPNQILQLPAEPLERIRNFVDDYSSLTGQTFRPRYYQVLALLFTECFFADQQQPDRLDMNSEEEKQRMLAYWMATGSGKTHIMHLNILQYLHHFCQKDNARLQIFLTTPLANLIKQHERELEPYIRSLNDLHNNRIELISHTTQGLLQKEDDYFHLPDEGEIYRLTLVDEAHIGLTSQQSGKFRELRRNRLNVGNSFLFEYSATFHNVAKELKGEYDNATIYKYDYTRFYNDGYGKDHFFKPIAADKVDTKPAREIKDNLDECLRVMEEKLQTFNRIQQDEQYDNDLTVHRPLMAFMGHTVDNPKEEGKDDKDEVSDIQKVLDYLAALNEGERQKFRSIFGGNIIGTLVVARNPNNNSELLLSYGDGEKWGMINVGDATGFYNSIENRRIETRVEAIENPNLHFENLDNETSPINVLIGSRKFAEGWNSYHLSVIDLINLGSAKGNLIIQIFGRGVRLRGKGGDGKRRYIDHKSDYYLLRQRDKEDDIRRLEMLTVFSLKRSYLEHFLKEVRAGGIPLYHTFKIKVNPTFFKVDNGATIHFNEYQNKLPIFKQSGSSNNAIKRVVFSSDKSINYTYVEDNTEQHGVIHNWQELILDYRTDKDKEPSDAYKKLQKYNKEYFCYLNRASLATVIRREAEKNYLQLYHEGNRYPTILDFLALVGEIRYRKAGKDKIAWTDRLNRQVVIDVIRKLRNRINVHINRTNYVYEPLNQDDFIYEYTVTKEFKKPQEYDAFLAKIKEAEKKRDQSEARRIDPEIRIKKYLCLPLEANHRHIYEPLLLDLQGDKESELNEVKVSPDRLNSGEKKFVEDVTAYIKLHYRENKRYEFYLMRNAQKIGIYLESDAGVYYPDFVLWVLDTQQDITHILFIDPKGQRGIIDDRTLDYQNHPKVKLARKSEDETLVTLEKCLEVEQARRFRLHSFLLLRDSSKLGEDQTDEWIEENMLAYNIFRLNWHEKTEDGSLSLFRDRKWYLDLMFEKAEIR